MSPHPPDQRTLIDGGSPWESEVGYSRAVVMGNQIFIAGTTATDEQGQCVAVGDAHGQTTFILRKIQSVLKQCDADLSHVVRTRLFVTDIGRWQEIGRAHGEFFRTIRPAATMVEVQRLIDPHHLVEIEVDALLPSARD